MAEKPRILLVDDEPSVVKMVGKRLEVEGFEVLAAMSGEAALATAQAEPLDCIILDLMMPGLDGYEVCRRLRQGGRHQRTPVVVLTAKGKPEDEAQAMAVGANAFIRKPFRAEEVIQKIRALIST